MEETYTEQSPTGLSQEQVEAEAETTQESQPAQSIADKQKEMESQQELNFKRMREKHDEEKRQLSDQINQLEQKLRANSGLKDDDLVEGRHFMGMKEEVEKLRQEMRQAQQKSMEMADESRLKNQYTDLYNVVNEDNLKKLKEVDPIAHETILSSPNLYSRGHMAYQAIKKWGITDAQENEERIKENSSKPQITGNTGALSKAEAYKNYLSKDEKKAKWEEVQRYMRGI